MRRTTQWSNKEPFQLGTDTEAGNIEIGKTAVGHTDIEAGNIEIGTDTEIGVKQQLKQKQG